MSEPDLLSCVEIDPADSADAAVIWLHGLGADGHDFEPIVPHLGLDPSLAVRFVFPHAPRRPVTINMGMVMPAWYDILELSLDRKIDTDGLHASSAAVEALIEREIQRGVPLKRILLAGFSQGGAVALEIGCRRGAEFGGVCGLSTYLPLEPEDQGGARDATVFMAHGTRDPMVPAVLGRAAADRLRERGAQVEWQEYPCEHAVHPEEIVAIGRWISRVLRVERPA